MKARLFVLGVMAIGTIILVTLPVSPTPVVAQGPVGSAPTIGYAVKTGSSPALRDMLSQRWPLNPTPREVPLFRSVNLRRPVPNLPQSLVRDPVLQSRFGSVRMPFPIQNFEGMDSFAGGRWFPPDTNGDIGYDPGTGKKYYVEWVNVAYQVWDVTSTPVTATIPINGDMLWNTLGAPCNNLTGDPTVLFDTLAHRWLASAMAWPNFPNGPFHQCVALSKAADPTGQYWLYDFAVSNTKFNDYPKFAVWPDGYYLSVNQYNAGSQMSAGAGAYVFDRNKMLSGDPSAGFQYFDLPNQFSMLPSNLNGPTLPPSGSPNYFVQLGYDAFGTPQNPLQVWQFHTDWVISTNSTITLAANLTAASFNSNLCGFSDDCIPQPGTTNKVDALADRLMYRLQYRNFVDHETMVVNHTVAVGDFANHAGIRWYEFRKTGSVWSIYQQGTYAPDADHRWMASIAMDGEGNIALGYSVSSGTTYPSIRYAGRLASDPLDLLPQFEVTLAAGSGYQTQPPSDPHRWGDYTSMSIDPVDDCMFWYTNEYYTAAGISTSNWQTRIGSFWLCRNSRPQLTYFFPVVLKNAAP